MVLFDLIILGIVVISILVGVKRGFVREALSLAAWIFAVYGAWRLGPFFAPQFRPYIENDMLAISAAYVIVFIFLLVLFSVLVMFLARLWRITAPELRGVDRSLGAMFGLARGALIVFLVVMFAEQTKVTQAHWWQQSLLVPYIRGTNEQIYSWLPESMQKSNEAYPTIGRLSE